MIAANSTTDTHYSHPSAKNQGITWNISRPAHHTHTPNPAAPHIAVQVGRGLAPAAENGILAQHGTAKVMPFPFCFCTGAYRREQAPALRLKAICAFAMFGICKRWVAVIVLSFMRKSCGINPTRGSFHVSIQPSRKLQGEKYDHRNRIDTSIRPFRRGLGEPLFGHRKAVPSEYPKVTPWSPSSRGSA